MLIKISENIYIDLKDIYLVDYDDQNGELLIYINQHPKYPVTVKNKEDISLFKRNLEDYQREQIINARRISKNEQEASQDILEFPNAGAETPI